jgi:hypothetical protein
MDRTYDRVDLAPVQRRRSELRASMVAWRRIRMLQRAIGLACLLACLSHCAQDRDEDAAEAQEGSEAKSAVSGPQPATLESFRACGGDPTGEWDAESLTFGIYDRPAALETPACRDTVEAVEVIAYGGARFDRTQVAFDVSFSPHFETNFDEACVAELRDVQPADRKQCVVVGRRLARAQGYASDICTLGPPPCSCRFGMKPKVLTTEDAYSVEGSELAFGAGSLNPFCVHDDLLELRLVVNEAPVLLVFRRAGAVGDTAGEAESDVTLQALVGEWSGKAKSRQRESTLDMALTVDTAGQVTGEGFDCVWFVDADGTVLGQGSLTFQTGTTIHIPTVSWETQLAESRSEMSGELYIYSEPFFDMDVTLTKRAKRRGP